MLTIINVPLTESSLFYGGMLLHVCVYFALCKLGTDWLVMVESKVFIFGSLSGFFIEWKLIYQIITLIILISTNKFFLLEIGLFQLFCDCSGNKRSHLSWY